MNTPLIVGLTVLLARCWLRNCCIFAVILCVWLTLSSLICSSMLWVVRFTYSPVKLGIMSALLAAD